MKTALYILAGALVLLIVAGVVMTWQANRPVVEGQLTSEVLNNLEVAPIELAFTFARTQSGSVLMVVGVDGKSSITGIDLSQALGTTYVDGLEAYNDLGEARLEALAQSGDRQVVKWVDLAMPIDESYPHVAAGTNYRAHAAEVGLDGTPFLFPKLVHPTAWNADVIRGQRMDYEVEICAVPVTDHRPEIPAKLAYILCNDFTDRWALMAHLDREMPMGRTGFTIGKGGETWFPIGPLITIPRSDEFYRSIDIELYVNNVLRQRSSGDLMVWSPSKIVDKTIEDCQSAYHSAAGIIQISSCDVIPARTFILTGTPEGVMFRISTVWNPFAYLASGDVVVATGRYLGYLQNTLVDEG